MSLEFITTSRPDVSRGQVVLSELGKSWSCGRRMTGSVTAEELSESQQGRQMEAE